MIETHSGEKLPALTNIKAFPTQYYEGVRAVTESLRKTGENPHDFFVEVSSENDRQILVFHLWYKTAFARKYRHFAGDPTGKGRDVRYDTKAGQITQTLFWK